MSLSTPGSVQKLQTALHDKAKESPSFRFYALYDKVYRKDVLAFAYECCKANGGAAGVDGQKFEDIEAYGRERWLDELTQELKNRTYQPLPVRRVYIPKPDGKQRPLGVPAIRDRVAEMAAVLVLEPIFEADLLPEQYAYRRDRSALDAVRHVHKLLNTGHGEIVDADLSSYFDTLPHSELMKSVARRVVDRAMLHLIKMWLEAPVEETDERGNKRRSTHNRDEGRGSPQGSPLTPRTQKITSNLTARSSWSVGHGTANDTSSNLAICRIWLYLYVICLAPVPLRGHNASIAHAPCCSVAVHSPQQFSSLPKCAPFPLARPIAISGRPSA
jgi:retron-type reverse transcriptase